MKKSIYKKLSLFGLCLLANTLLNAQTTETSSFEDIIISSPNDIKIPSQGYVNTKLNDGSIEVENKYDISYGGFWVAGWAYSKVKDTITSGAENLYASYANGGANNSTNYAVVQNNSTLKLNKNNLKGLYLSNTTYAALSMKNGDAFAKKFGGQTGNDSDWYKLTIKAYKNGLLKNDSVEFYLADFRFSNNVNDYIIKDWTYLNLQKLGSLDSLSFELNSSDKGAFGINTPAFFCVDQIITDADTATFEALKLPFGQDYWNRGSKVFTETYTSGNLFFNSSYSVSPSFNYWNKGFAISNFTDSVTPGSENIYSAISGKGAQNTSNYAVVNGNAGIKVRGVARVREMWINNSTYAYYSMKNGDAFGKKFGGSTGNDTDYFRVIIYAHGGFLQGKKDSTIFYLADFRNKDNSKDYIINNWTMINLPFIFFDSLSFKLESSDEGQFGINTPAYFCIDQIQTQEYISVNELTNRSNLQVYPNPSSNKIFVDFNKGFTAINIIDLQGKVVLTSNQIDINIEGLENGIYLCQLVTETGVLSTKFIKQ
jgi:hypothetical protein